MTPGDRRILKEFSERLRSVVPDAAIRAFGSRARGAADAESDLDICVVVPMITPEVREAVSSIAWEVGFENDCTLIAPIILSRHDFESGPMSASTLVAHILRDGVAA